jgi:hypothetical protein
LYTAAVGDGTYRYNDQLAYGISWHWCPGAAHQAPADVQLSWTFWLFLDANAGAMLEGVWQQGS